MNKKEYYSCGNNTQNKYWRYTQKLLKEWMAKNNITEPCVVHHIDNEPNAIKYNNEHYELWGHEIDKNGNLKFELGKYVQFMTRVEHSRYHNTGEKNHHYGLHLSEDHKNKISNAMKNGNSPWYGKQLSEEHKKKLSLSHMGKTLTPEQRAKISAANKGRVVSPETRKKMSDALKGRKHDIYISEERRNALSIANKGENNPMWGKKHTAATKAKMKGFSILWDVYKNNDGTKSYNEFKHAIKTGDITFEMQPISMFINQ